MKSSSDGLVETNEFGQKLGRSLDGWQAPPYPSRDSVVGLSCRVEPLEPSRHAEDLWSAYALDQDGTLWTYLSIGPFDRKDEFLASLRKLTTTADPQFYAIVQTTSGRAVGLCAYLRIDPPNGSIEIGWLAYSPELQRTRAATEAMYLMMRRAFDLGYRRYEWKCNSLNEPSIAAALRLGFTYEGTFRQAVVSKGRNRDTSWFSILDSEWPDRRRRLEAWLDPANFDENGVQKLRLSR